MFAVGQEFLVAWAWRLFGGRGSLHAFAAIVMAFVAATAVFGVFGWAWEASRSASWSFLAAGIFTVLPFNYRTVGMVLQREDLSVPLLSLAIWAVARGARSGSRSSWIAAGCLATLSLATWHAMAFFSSLVVAALWSGFLRSGRSPFETARSFWVPLVVVLGCLVIPVLRSKGLVFAPAMLGTYALVAVAALARRRELTGWQKRGAALAALAACFALAALVRAVGLGNQQDYGHVFSFLLAKLSHLGQLPADPERLSFEARLLWQGPFVTASAGEFWIGLGRALALVAAVLAFSLWLWWRSPGRDGLLTATGLFAISLFSAWLVRRTMILPAMLVGPLAAACFARTRFDGGARLLALLVLLTQGAFFFPAIRQTRQTWYEPRSYTADLRHMAEWIEANVPRQEAVLADFVASTTILSSSQHPILLQPKYETRRSRERIQRFYEVFGHGSWMDMADLMREWDCRWLLIDRTSLWSDYNRYIMGYPKDRVQPDEGTPAFTTGSTPPRPPPPGSGFRLVYKTPDGSPTDSMRLYLLE
jgi:hypothetical protein